MTPTRAVHVLVFDGFADWEPAFALAELRRSGKRVIRAVGFTNAEVVSMGGLRVMPDVVLSKVTPADVEIFILPGGDSWEAGAYPREEVERLVHALIAAQVPVAAICGATIALARAGVLNDRAHTGNLRAELQANAPEYTGGSRYADALAVRDRRVVTASGLGAVDFAREIFAELEVFSASDQALWFAMHKHGQLPEAVVE